jgi:hypothetical protein
VPQISGPLEIYLIVNFRIRELVEVRASWSKQLQLKKIKKYNHFNVDVTCHGLLFVIRGLEV